MQFRAQVTQQIRRQSINMISSSLEEIFSHQNFEGKGL